METAGLGLGGSMTHTDVFFFRPSFQFPPKNSVYVAINDVHQGEYIGFDRGMGVQGCTCSVWKFPV